MNNLRNRISALVSAAVMACAVAVPATNVNAASGVAIDATNFPDEAFRNYVLEEKDTDKDGILSLQESGTMSIEVSGKGIKDLTGISKFRSLVSLDCSNNELKELKIGSLGYLAQLNCSNNELTELDTKNNPRLNTLNCSNNHLEDLSLYNNTQLVKLICSNNELSTFHVFDYKDPITGLTQERFTILDIKDLTKLEVLDYSSNPKVGKVYWEFCPALRELNCSGTAIMTVDVSQNTQLQRLSCSGVGTLELGDSDKLEYLDCSYSGIIVLDLSNKPNLKELHCFIGSFKKIDVSKNPNLEVLDCSLNNYLKGIDVSKNPNLRSLSCGDSAIEELDVSSNTKLTYLQCNKTKIKTLDVSNNPALKTLGCQDNSIKKLDLSNNKELSALVCVGTDIETLDLRNCPQLIKALNGKQTTWRIKEPQGVIYKLSEDNYVCVDEDMTIIPAAPSATPIPSPTSSVRRPSATPVPTAHPTTVPVATPVSIATKEEPTATPYPATTIVRKTSDSPITDFVERIYENVLGREPEEAGTAFWTDELYNFRRTGAEVGLNFILSDEFVGRGLSDDDFVSVLYKTFFNRDPEEAGFKFWTAALEDGKLDRQAVANGFIFSQEWADTCASYGIRSGGVIAPQIEIKPTKATLSFVERMYTTAMQRESDAEGKAFWSKELANFRYNGEQVGVMFFLSEEMQNFGLDNDEFVTRLYKTFMDREPEEGGFVFWVNYLNEGGTREGAVLGFTRSEEFVKKCISARILPN